MGQVTLTAKEGERAREQTELREEPQAQEGAKPKIVEMHTQAEAYTCSPLRPTVHMKNCPR